VLYVVTKARGGSVDPVATASVDAPEPARRTARKA
jgi:hypothetical protein